MQRTWWKEGVVYQIYPRSFYDSNGDGIGDLRGIIEKLDYLKELGVDIVWLSPVYKSPNDDNGYDISDYQAIMHEFGTLADWEELLAELHRHDIKLIMDLVVNHTSDEHPWFVEARKSRDNPYRDYYIWRTGRGVSEPNNWESIFGGSAWEYNAATDDYYLHLFSRKQPDLNWENPDLRAAIYDMMHWWLQKGIDGFRMDAINLISKTPGLPDAPIRTNEAYQSGSQYYINGPRLLEFLREMKEQVLSKYDVFAVGETPLVTTEHAITLTHQETGYLSMLFHGEHLDIDTDLSSSAPKWTSKPWSLLDLKQVLSRWQKDLEAKGWNSFFLTNHDLPRAVSRYGDDGVYRAESATLLATLLQMLHGTPYIFQGEEIGMTNVRFASIDAYRDIDTRNLYQTLVLEQGVAPEMVMAMIHARSRDNARTPMQWDDSANAGFTTGIPWINVNPNYQEINVHQALADPNGILAYYQQLIRLRKAYPIIVYGTYDLILDANEQIFAFTRTFESERLLIILNFSKDTPLFELPSHISWSNTELLISNYDVDLSEDIRQVTLRPFEARVYRLW